MVASFDAKLIVANTSLVRNVNIVGVLCKLQVNGHLLQRGGDEIPPLQMPQHSPGEFEGFFIRSFVRGF